MEKTYRNKKYLLRGEGKVWENYVSKLKTSRSEYLYGKALNSSVADHLKGKSPELKDFVKMAESGVYFNAIKNTSGEVEVNSYFDPSMHLDIKVGKFELALINHFIKKALNSGSPLIHEKRIKKNTDDKIYQLQELLDKETDMNKRVSLELKIAEVKKNADETIKIYKELGKEDKKSKQEGVYFTFRSLNKELSEMDKGIKSRQSQVIKESLETLKKIGFLKSVNTTSSGTEVIVNIDNCRMVEKEKVNPVEMVSVDALKGMSKNAISLIGAIKVIDLAKQAAITNSDINVLFPKTKEMKDSALSKFLHRLKTEINNNQNLTYVLKQKDKGFVVEKREVVNE